MDCWIRSQNVKKGTEHKHLHRQSPKNHQQESRNKWTNSLHNEMILSISAIVSLIDLVPSINPWLGMHNKSPTVSSHQNASLRSWTSLEESSDHSFVIYVYELIFNISTFLYIYIHKGPNWHAVMRQILGCNRWWSMPDTSALVHQIQHRRIKPGTAQAVQSGPGYAVLVKHLVTVGNVESN